jgi:hypothetical protein
MSRVPNWSRVVRLSQGFATLASVVATGARGGANHRGATSIDAARLGILRSSTFREEAHDAKL